MTSKIKTASKKEEDPKDEECPKINNAFKN